MAFSKAEQFGEKDFALARYAKAMSHPARVAILKLLSKQDCCYCGDIVQDLPIAQSTVSQHLKELKNAGLIEGEITMPKVRYCLNKESYDKAKSLFEAFFA